MRLVLKNSEDALETYDIVDDKGNVLQTFDVEYGKNGEAVIEEQDRKNIKGSNSVCC